MDDEPADQPDALDASGPDPSAGNGTGPSRSDDLDEALTGLVDGYEPPVESGPDVWAATTATAVNPLAADTILAEREPDEADDTPVPSRAAKPPKPPWRAIREWLTVLVIALGAAVLIRVFVFQQYYIDGPSMEHTLEPHDRVLVNKLSYRLHDVNRGDVVVFDRLSDGTQHDDLIKRVIGLPGETVSIENCVVFIDGKELDEPYLSTQNQAQADPAARCRIPVFGPEEVPDDHVFVMGDNRPQSFDSREFGPIEIDQIRGRAFVVIWPFSNWTWL
jgi:signal peptidase I